MHGVFSYHLIEALSGQGLNDEGARPISIADIYNYINSQDATARDPTNTIRVQNPDLASTIIASYGY